MVGRQRSGPLWVWGAVLVAALWLPGSRGQVCNSDIEESYQCFEQQMLNFQASCPRDERVVIDQVYYAIGSTEECPTTANQVDDPFNFQAPDRCVIEDMSELMKRACNNENRCQLNLFKTFDSATCPQHKGKHFLEVKYKCDPMVEETNPDVKLIEMCEDITWSGRYAEITSSKDGRMTGSIPCMCEITKPANSIIYLESLEYELEPRQDTCSFHHTYVSMEQGAQTKICTDNGLSWKLGCGLAAKKITLSYFTTSVWVDAKFTLHATVPRHSEMTVRCGIPNPEALTYPPSTTLRRTTTTFPRIFTWKPPSTPSPPPGAATPTDPAPSEGQGSTTEAGPEVGRISSGLGTGAIVGISIVVVGVIVAAVVVFVVFFIFKRRGRRGDKLDSGASGQLVDSSTDSSGSGSTRTASDRSSEPPTLSKPPPEEGAPGAENLAFIAEMGEFATVPDTLTGQLAADRGSLYGTINSVSSFSSFVAQDNNLKREFYKGTGSIGSLRSTRGGNSTVASRGSLGRVGLHNIVLEENIDATLVLEGKKADNNKLFQRFDDSAC